MLLAADGLPNTDIASRVGAVRQTVIDCRSRYAEHGIADLDEEARPSSAARGRPQSDHRGDLAPAAEEIQSAQPACWVIFASDR